MKLLIFAMMFVILVPFSAWGVSSLGCLGATVAEYLIPGLGYAVLGHYDKMIVLGGSRWLAINKYLTYSGSDDYEEYNKKIYKKTELSDGKEQHDFFYSRETYFANAFSFTKSDVFIKLICCSKGIVLESKLNNFLL